MRPRMRHLAALTLVAALTAAVPAAPAAKRKPVTSVRVVKCAKGPTVAERRAIFRGAMRRVRGSERMWMKFRLQERVGGPRFRTVKAPGLGVWRKSRAGVRKFAVRQRVLALGEGAAYRVAVQYRWYDGDGELVRRERRRSRPCTQPGLLPNLRVVRIVPRTTPNGTVQYLVDVLNRGRVPSTATTVALTVDGDLIDTPALGPLAPREIRRVVVTGPGCSTLVAAKVDPADTVRESNEADNTRALACAP